HDSQNGLSSYDNCEFILKIQAKWNPWQLLLGRIETLWQLTLKVTSWNRDRDRSGVICMMPPGIRAYLIQTKQEDDFIAK
ncbi:hypothetical protein STEG23_011521, partial [Scotinomys teguina]